MTGKFDYLEWDCDDDDIALSSVNNTSFGDVVDARISRRQTLKNFIALAALPTASAATGAFAQKAWADSASTLTFMSASHTIKPNDQVAPGYDANVLIRWGDGVERDAPGFDVTNLSGAAQAKQFGYNCDYVGYVSLPMESNSSNHGLLCVNHESTDGYMMRSGVKRGKDSFLKADKRWVEIEMAAHGHSVIEVKQDSGIWAVVSGSRYARRITPMTKMRVSGPAAGHDRLKTASDPTGREVFGTISNCAGGITPWGTVLIAEENFHGYFGGNPKKARLSGREITSLKRYGISGRPRYPWFKYFDRFNIEKEPNEPNRFGYIVEYDPYNPASVPVKRTAMGRAKHEGANVWIQSDNRVIAYSGDDQDGEYLYKFVSARKFNPSDRNANLDLLDTGTLSVARFNDDGSVDWLPLVFGQGKLTTANGFKSQADICIETRRAADLVGATRMDRPEEVQVNPKTGKIYVMLSNNWRRGSNIPVDAANPRRKNLFGHIIEIEAPGGSGKDANHVSNKAAWSIFMLCGDPSNPKHGAKYHKGQKDIWLSSPDNIAFDQRGRMWIATDQGSAQRRTGIPDGLYATDTEGPGRALVKFFYACPKDAELCGPMFTPDSTTLFIAVQHPGEARGSSFDNPSTRWPDFKPGMPPRPSVVAVTKKSGGVIGS